MTKKTKAELEAAIAARDKLIESDELGELIKLLLDKNVIKVTDLTGKLKTKHDKIKD